MSNWWLLSDEFVAFSQKIAKIVDEKKALKKQLKEFYEKIQSQIDILEKEAKDLESEFETFKQSDSPDVITEAGDAH